MLRGRGHSVTIPPNSKAESHSEWKKHTDNGDLYINQRIEVKRLGVNFSNRLDWPFRERFIVCAKHSYDLSVPKPYAYVILNKNCTNAAIVLASDSDKWFVESRKDSRYESVEQEFYFCPMDYVRFIVLSRDKHDRTKPAV
jgi:hypothetical protein